MLSIRLRSTTMLVFLLILCLTLARAAVPSYFSGPLNVPQGSSYSGGTANIAQVSTYSRGTPNVPQISSYSRGTPSVPQVSSYSGGTPNVPQGSGYIEPTPHIPPPVYQTGVQTSSSRRQPTFGRRLDVMGRNMFETVPFYGRSLLNLFTPRQVAPLVHVENGVIVDGQNGENQGTVDNVVVSDILAISPSAAHQPMRQQNAQPDYSRAEVLEIQPAFTNNQQPYARARFIL